MRTSLHTVTVVDDEDHPLCASYHVLKALILALDDARESSMSANRDRAVNRAINLTDALKSALKSTL